MLKSDHQRAVVCQHSLFMYSFSPLCVTRCLSDNHQSLYYFDCVALCFLARPVWKLIYLGEAEVVHTLKFLLIVRHKQSSVNLWGSFHFCWEMSCAWVSVEEPHMEKNTGELLTGDLIRKLIATHKWDCRVSTHLWMRTIDILLFPPLSTEMVLLSRLMKYLKNYKCIFVKICMFPTGWTILTCFLI